MNLSQPGSISINRKRKRRTCIPGEQMTPLAVEHSQEPYASCKEKKTGKKFDRGWKMQILGFE